MPYFAPYIDGTGLHMPTYEDRLSDLVSAYRSIFGIDAEMSESVPDYQLLGRDCRCRTEMKERISDWIEKMLKSVKYPERPIFVTFL